MEGSPKDAKPEKRPGPTPQWTEIVNISFSEEQLDAIDRVASELGQSRAGLVRLVMVAFIRRKRPGLLGNGLPFDESDNLT